MPGRLQLILTDAQQTELVLVRDHHAKAYVRERAAALLKIAQHVSGRQVALQGLLKPRCPDTVYAWFANYQQAGVAGLLIKAGRGRKPAFSPSVPDAQHRPGGHSGAGA